MATFKYLVLSHQQHNDGSYNVKVRVTHKRESRYLPTTVYAFPTDLTRSLKIKSPTLKSKLDALLSQLHAVMSELSPFALDSMSCSELVAWMRKRLSTSDFHLGFITWCEQFAATQAPSMRPQFVTAINAFRRFTEGEDIDINSINASMLYDFADFCDREPKQTYVRSIGTIVTCRDGKRKHGAGFRYLTLLKRAYTAAKMRYNDENVGVIVIPRSPFDGLKVKQTPSRGQKSLSREIMRSILTDDSDLPYSERFALDMFCISFLTMGTNMADLFEMERPRKGWLIYYRKKVRDRKADRGEMRIKVVDELHPYVERNAGTDMLLVLSVISANARGVTGRVNTGLKRYAERRGLEPFTFYAARHTWATMARKAGVEKATIDECLCHNGELKMADIYIDRDFELLARANRTTIDFVMGK